MKMKFILLFSLFTLFAIMGNTKVMAQNPVTNWSYTYGGSSYDSGMAGLKTADGNYVTASITESSDFDVSNSLGGEDIWLIKTNSGGDLIWEKSFGGSDYDRAFDLVETSDNGFLIVGTTWSNDGDIPANKGGSDLLVLKIDEDGNLEWAKNYGGSSDDGASAVISNQNGNFVIAGTTSSNNGDVSGNHGDLDIWVIEIDNQGNLIRQKTYGGSDQDWTKSIRQTTDGGYFIGGTSRSQNGDISSPILWDDVWVVKTDGSGAIEWEKSFGGTDFDVANDAQQTADGGYIVAGYTWSDDGDVSELYGSKDVWILKLDNLGNLEWENNYGGTEGDGAYAIEIVNGGYVFQANVASSDHDITNHMGSDDVWLVKIDNAGEIIWEKSYGGSGKDWAESLFIDNNSFFIAAYTASTDFDIPENKGLTDVWIISINDNSQSEECTWTVIVQDPDYFGDEVSWELRRENGEVLLSGGNYGAGYYDEQSVVAPGPLEFYISAIGTTNDNKPAYSVANDNGVILWGVNTGGTENTFSNLNCSDPAWVEDYSCEEQFMTTNEIVGAFEIGGSDLHNQLAIDIPVNNDGFTLYGIKVNFFVTNPNNTEFSFILFDDDDGKPGSEITTTTSQIEDAVYIGNAFGRDLYEFTLNFTDDLNLNPNQRYWLELVTAEGAWQSINFTPIGKGVAYKNDYTNGEWVVDLTSEFIYTLVCDEFMGMNDTNQPDFSYYPNPLNDKLNINSNQSIHTISIFDLSGNQLKSLNISNQKSTVINLNDLKAGVYLVKVIFENKKVETFKVLKN